MRNRNPKAKVTGVASRFGAAVAGFISVVNARGNDGGKGYGLTYV